MAGFDEAVAAERGKAATQAKKASDDPVYKREVHEAVAALKTNGRVKPSRFGCQGAGRLVPVTVFEVLTRTQYQSSVGLAIWQSPRQESISWYGDEEGNLYSYLRAGNWTAQGEPVTGLVRLTDARFAPRISEIAAYLVEHGYV